MAAEMAGDRQLSLSGFAARRKARKAACTLLETETLPSVKNWALGKDLLCRVLHSAKNCTRQKNALGKGLLCRVPDSRQKRGTRHRITRVMVFRHVLLCRVPAVRHSAKIYFFFKKNSLPSVPALALGKDLFFLNVFAEFPVKALGKEEI